MTLQCSLTSPVLVPLLSLSALKNCDALALWETEQPQRKCGTEDTLPLLPKVEESSQNPLGEGTQMTAVRGELWPGALSAASRGWGKAGTTVQAPAGAAPPLPALKYCLLNEEAFLLGVD